MAAAIPAKAAPMTPPMSCLVRENESASGSEMSCRIMNEKADVMSAMQLATNKRRGFME
jgi:hypothetical protein